MPLSGSLVGGPSDDAGTAPSPSFNIRKDQALIAQLTTRPVSSDHPYTIPSVGEVPYDAGEPVGRRIVGCGGRCRLRRTLCPRRARTLLRCRRPSRRRHARRRCPSSWGWSAPSRRPTFRCLKPSRRESCTSPRNGAPAGPALDYKDDHRTDEPPFATRTSRLPMGSRATHQPNYCAPFEDSVTSEFPRPPTFYVVR